MRLDDIDTSGVDVEDQRGSGGGGGGFGFPMGGGGGGGLPLGRGMGCGTILLLLAIAYFSGGNLGSIMGGMGGMEQSAPVQQQSEMTQGQGCEANQASKFSCQVLASANQTWEKAFTDGGYKEPKIVFYSGGGQSGCGAAQSAMGPFYCPADQGIYLDTSFYDELSRKFGAAGDFAQAYVIAHEVGHHLQYLTGRANQVRQAQERASKVQGNQLQVRMELQADCYAGVWAAKNKERMEPGDVEEGLRAAHQIGDDVLMKQSQGVVVPEAFTHGSAEQRMAALKLGLSSGNEDACETFFQQ
ncbi:MAG TPA: neutral zinc metallopeptidase [Chakrabartia sp.]|jgi:predicted metalloprotease|nr:neutral zinc metallopeptidase [Chakrabartia sp.]